MRSRAAMGWRSLRAAWLQIVQMSVAAGLAWEIAHGLLHHAGAFFAPVAAVIALGLGPGKRIERAVEMAFGVAAGILVGDLLIAHIGSGSWQTGLVVLLAVSVTLLAGGGPLAVSQAAGSAVLIATLVPPSHGSFYTQRFVDALVGGAVGVAVLVVAPGNLSETARRSARLVFAALADVLNEIADAIESRDVRGAETALGHARDSEATVRSLLEQLELAQESARIAPRHWRDRETLARYATAAIHLELAIRDVRVLARATLRLVELEPDPPIELAHSVRELRRAALVLEGELSSGAGHRSTAIAAAAAGGATSVLEERSSLAVSAVVAQIRSAATDLLRARGLERTDAVQQIRAAA